MNCICRNCGKVYDEYKSKADYKGYCSQQCLHAMAKSCGYRGKSSDLKTSEYWLLKEAGKIGNLPAALPAEPPAPTIITDRMIYDAITTFLPKVCEVYDHLDDTIGNIPDVDALAPRIEVALQCAREAIASLPYDDPVNPPDPAPSHDEAHDAEPYDGLS